MTFTTYTGALDTDLERVRFEIGDIVENAGPRPNSTNFSDEEIAAILTEEGSVGRTAARLCEVLAVQWSTESGRVSFADVSEDYTARAQGFRDEARRLRLKYGGRLATSQPAVTRVDGFSDDIDAEDT